MLGLREGLESVILPGLREGKRRSGYDGASAAYFPIYRRRDT
jgi:hypothetical protein